MSPVRIPNPRVIFAKVPSGYPVLGETLVYQPDAETIDLDNVPLNGGILTKTHYISLDPNIRGMMRDPAVKAPNPALPLGQPPASGAIVKVIRSETPKFKVGDYLGNSTLRCPGFFAPWRLYNVFPADIGADVLDNNLGLPWSVYLGAGGLVGASGFFPVHAFAKFEPGQTVFVSSAAGTVGSVVVQLAKLHGLKVIGSAGSDDKVATLNEFGVDVPFNYKKESVWEVLEKHGPIDVYFDTVGGEQLDAALLNAIPKGARFIMCGYTSQYNDVAGKEHYGIKNMDQILWKRIDVHPFFIPDLTSKYGHQLFAKEFLPLLKDGKVQYKEDRSYGLEKLPEAVIKMLTGDNKGKSVVVVAEDEN